MRRPSQAASDFHKNLLEARLLLVELSQQLEDWRAFNAAAVVGLGNAREWVEETGETGPRFEDGPLEPCRSLSFYPQEIALERGTVCVEAGSTSSSK